MGKGMRGGGCGDEGERMTGRGCGEGGEEEGM